MGTIRGKDGLESHIKTVDRLHHIVLALTGFVIGSAKMAAILALWSRSLDWHQMPWIKHSEAASDETRRLAFL